MRRRSIPILLGLAFVLLLLGIRILDPYPVRIVREIAFDTFQQIKPREPIDAAVRIADIDEASLAAVGQWPWSRDVMARLTDRLTELGAAAIVFDVLFPEADRTSPAFLNQWLAQRGDAQIATTDGAPLADYDAEFANSLAFAPAVLGFGIAPGGAPPPERAKAGIAVVGSNPVDMLPRMGGVVMSLPALRDAAIGAGSITLEPGGTLQSVRRLPLLWTNGTEIFPSLSVEALRVALGQDSLVVFGDQSNQGTVESIRIGDFEVPTNTDGSFWMYYRPSDPNLYVSVKDILNDPASVADKIAGNIVMIGTSATGLLDIRGTALGTDMPGVEIHAQAIEQMVGQRFLSRADWLSGLEILAFLVIGVGVVLIIMRSGPWVCLVIGGVLAVALLAVTWTAFITHGLLVDPTFPLGGSFIVYSAMIFFQFTISDADKRLVRRAFSSYVDPELLAQIEKSPEGLKLGGEIRELSVLFLDIRGFTTLSEGAEPAALVHMLNILFGALGTSITENYGTIDKFIGDSIMAFWNAPVDVPNHPRRACLAALGMRKTLVKLNADGALKLQDGKAREVAIGIGVSTGPALVGNLGLESRFDYSCIGNTVNVASRVEGASKTVGYDIVVSGSTREQCAELAFLDAGSISLKGKTVREELHLVVGDETLAQTPAFKALVEAHGRVVADMVAGRSPRASIAGCLTLIADVDPHLAKFYAILPERAEDFPQAVAA